MLSEIRIPVSFAYKAINLNGWQFFVDIENETFDVIELIEINSSSFVLICAVPFKKDGTIVLDNKGRQIKVQQNFVVLSTHNIYTYVKE